MKIEARRRKAARDRKRWNAILADAQAKGLSKVAGLARRKLAAIAHIKEPKENA